MYLFDTDTMTWMQEGHQGIAARIRQVGEENIATTLVTEVEILRGRHEFLLKASDGEQVLRAQQLLDASKELLDTLPIIPFDASAADEFDKLRQNKKLKKIGRADLLIAAIALAQPATVVTRNVKHFRQVPGLQVENWVD
jgi:tRNA(fMet)-specific endonuclease VapC